MERRRPSAETNQRRHYTAGDAPSKKGKGPRNYRRTDERILDDINDRLCDNPYLDASQMEIGVKDGEVILEGTVASKEDKRLAEQIAEEVSGVMNVENRLRVTIRGI